MLVNVLLVAVGGGLGAAARYLAGLWIVARLGAEDLLERVVALEGRHGRGRREALELVVEAHALG